jgi:hypothetical protein
VIRYIFDDVPSYHYYAHLLDEDGKVLRRLEIGKWGPFPEPQLWKRHDSAWDNVKRVICHQHGIDVADAMDEGRE